MTAGQFREVDLDLLADYVGGALDGTPEQATVARLIVDDERWAGAHEALLIATGAVEADLAEWGATAEPMPEQVSERILAAIAADSAAPARRLAAAPGGRSATDTRPASRRQRRWQRWAAPVAVAAGVAAFAGFGISQLGGGMRANDDSTSISADGGRDSSAVEAAPQLALSAPPAADRSQASGTDYSPETLRALTSRRTADATPGTLAEPDGGGPPLSATGPVGAAPGLERLADETALAQCLDVVITEHASGPITVDLIDYASFQGSPALVLAFTDSVGQRWAWVAGPQCGQPGSGADTRYRTSVG